MNRYVVRKYSAASFIFDRDTREALFFDGTLASWAPDLLQDPDQDLTTRITAQYPSIPLIDLRDDLQRMAASIRAFTSAPNQPTIYPAIHDAKTINPMRQLARYARKHSQVITANVELTHWCNQRCRTCYLEDFTQRGLDATAFQRVLGQLQSIGTLFISFTGGEIFLRPDALELLEESTRHGFIPEIKTNGIPLTPQLAPRIAKLRLLDLQVSIYECQDGWSEFTRTHYPFDRLLATIQELQSASVPITVSVLVGKHNIDELPRYHERLAAAGITNVFYSPYITPSRTGNPNVIAYRLSQQELQSKLQPFLQRLGAIEHPTKYRNCGKHQPTCYAGRDQVAIGPQGDVYPCLDLRIVMGNILLEELHTIMKTQRQRLEPFLLADIPRCRECNVKAYCDSCVGTALLESGDFRTPSQHKCDITRLYCSTTN